MLPDGAGQISELYHFPTAFLTEEFPKDETKESADNDNKDFA